MRLCRCEIVPGATHDQAGLTAADPGGQQRGQSLSGQKVYVLSKTPDGVRRPLLEFARILLGRALKRGVNRHQGLMRLACHINSARSTRQAGFYEVFQLNQPQTGGGHGRHADPATSRGDRIGWAEWLAARRKVARRTP